MGQTCSGSIIETETLYFPETGAQIPVRSQRKFGWKRDLPDIRDFRLVISPALKTCLPPKRDLRTEECFPIYDQGHLGSCTANAIGAAFHFDMVKQGLNQFVPSRLFIYYNERAMEDSINYDAGAYIRDGVKCCKDIGVCPEDLWPYNEAQFTYKPPQQCYSVAANCTAHEFARVNQTLEDLKACINEGYPFVFGFVVYSSFMTWSVARTGKMSMPSAYDSAQGGHAVQACGYDDDRQVFVVRNSWGEGWGDRGFFYMPYDYMVNPDLVSDIWVIRSIDQRASRTPTLKPLRSRWSK